MEALRISVTSVLVGALAIAVIWTGLAGPTWFTGMNARGRLVLAVVLSVLLCAAVALELLLPHP